MAGRAAILEAPVGSGRVVMFGFPVQHRGQALPQAQRLGVVAALNRDRWPDRAIMGGVLLGSTMPGFWLGLILMLVFSVWLGWFPVSGARSWTALVLPVLTIGLGGTALAHMLGRGLAVCAGDLCGSPCCGALW